MLRDNELSWSWILFRGVAAMLAGVVMIGFPAVGLATAVMLFSFSSTVIGAFAIAAAFASRTVGWHRFFLVLEGIFGISLAVLALLWPAITLIYLNYMAAFWAVLIGLTEIWTAIQLRQVLYSPLWLALSGTASFVFGLLLAFFPISGVALLILLLGFYTLLFGAVTSIWAFQLRKRQHQLRQVPLGSAT